MGTRGKNFERVVRDAFLAVSGVSLDRLHDQMSGYKETSANVCDFIVYRRPHEYYLECKTTKGNVLPFSNVTRNQWEGLLQKSKINGVFAGIICWYYERDVTVYVPIECMEARRAAGGKSWRHDDFSATGVVDKRKPVVLGGRKKRKFFEYDMDAFFATMEGGNDGLWV